LSSTRRMRIGAAKMESLFGYSAETSSG